MFRMRSCPKCKTGAVGVDRDHYGWYEYCIQCGYIRDLIGLVESEKERQRGVSISDQGEEHD